MDTLAVQLPCAAFCSSLQEAPMMVQSMDAVLAGAIMHSTGAKTGMVTCSSSKNKEDRNMKYSSNRMLSRYV